MPRDLPTGTVTFVFTDIESSTKLLHELGAEGYAEALAEHRRILREAFGAHGGVEVDTQGDALFVAFPTAPGALRAAAAARDGLASGPIRVRMGIHTGTPHLAEEGYVGVDVHRAARVAACGHGGQVLVSAATAALLAGTDGLRDLGTHRLKDLSAPERIYQLGDQDFGPLRTLHQTNLPIQSTPFLGRERELESVIGLLSQDGIRALTLTGPGGTGKTRLAAQAGAELSARYPHGVWWVPLASLRDPTLVMETAGQVLGAKNGVAEHIADRSMLLLFDNFEQVIDAAPDLAALLAACPNLDLLTTSREPLRIGGEQEYRVPTLAHGEAVSFFLARAQAVRPDFLFDDAVPEICRRLDDLPLALELAAARVKVLSAEQLLQRLQTRLPLLTGGARDLPERQRTIRAAIEWSHELLTGAEQQLFARLAVFHGGCTLESAESVADAGLDDLQSLVDKSLLRLTDDRFWMLGTVHEYAAERLEQSGEAEDLRSRHAAHMLALVEDVTPILRLEVLRGRGKGLDRLGREHDNIRAALDRFDAHGEGERALRLAAAAWLFWYERRHITEGRRSIELALRADPRPTAARAGALEGAASLALFAGDIEAARMHAEERLRIHRARDEAQGIAEALAGLGYAIAEGGDPAGAQPLFEESVDALRRLGDEEQLVAVARSLAWSYAELGQNERARSLHEENLARARALHNQHYEAITLGALAMLAVSEDRFPDAIALLRQNLPIYRDLGDPFQTAVNLCRVARALAGSGRALPTAVRLLSFATALFEEIGANVPWVERMNRETLGIIHAQLDEPPFAEAWDRGRALAPDEADALAVEALGTATSGSRC